MRLLPATFTQLAPEFGQSLSRHKTALEVAAEWLWKTYQNQYPYQHAAVLVQDCKVRELEPIGVKRIDEMLGSDTGFMSGNVFSNLQSSMIIPAHADVEVNGFTKLDSSLELVFDKPGAVGLTDIPPGHLQQLALLPFMKSHWCSGEDKHVLAQIGKVLDPRSGKVNPHDAPTLVRVMHMRSKSTRHNQPSPVITHGWLLIGHRGELLYENCLNQTKVGHKMMERAKIALTCERFEAVDLLRIEGGKTTFVREDVLQHLQDEGSDTALLDLSSAQIGSAPTPVPEAAEETQYPMQPPVP